MLSVFPLSQKCRNRLLFTQIRNIFFVVLSQLAEQPIDFCLLVYFSIRHSLYWFIRISNYSIVFQANIVLDFFPSIRILLNHEVCHCSYTFIDPHGFHAVFSFSSSYSWASLPWSFPLSLQTGPKNPLRVFGKEEFHG